MIRSLAATVASVALTPREGMRVDFLPQVEGHDPVSQVTDAGGVFVVDLEIGVPYAVAFNGAVVIDGVEMVGAVTVIYLTAHEGEGTATLAECATLTLSTGWPVLLRRLVGCETAVASITARVAALEGI